MSLIDASLTGGSAEPCAVCGDPTTMRIEVGDAGRAPMCSRFCEHAWPNVKRLVRIEQIVRGLDWFQRAGGHWHFAGSTTEEIDELHDLVTANPLPKGGQRT